MNDSFSNIGFGAPAGFFHSRFHQAVHADLSTLLGGWRCVCPHSGSVILFWDRNILCIVGSSWPYCLVCFQVRVSPTPNLRDQVDSRAWLRRNRDYGKNKDATLPKKKKRIFVVPIHGHPPSLPPPCPFPPCVDSDEFYHHSQHFG